MAWLGIVGMGSFWAVSVWVGVRLLRLAARTRQVPELAIGLSFALSGALGYPLVVGSSVALHRAPAATPWLWGAGLLCISAGALALSYFNWRVFRPGAAGGAVFAALCLAMAVGTVGAGVATGFAAPGIHETFGWIGALSRAGVYAWASFETLRYHALMRRRLAIGLVDPESTRRFLYWGIGAGAATAIFANNMLRAGLGLDPDPRALGAALPTGVLGCTAAACIWLTFRTRAATAEPAPTSPSR
jgi:hypothetical protein